MPSLRMFKFLLLLIVFIFCQRNEIYSCLVPNRTVYVSSSMGKDSNDGYEIERPTNNLQKAIATADTILLKAGDVFYTNTLFIKGKKLSCYADGKKPVLCGYKRIIEPCWELVEKNIWRINLSVNNYDGLTFNGSSLSNNIGCIHEYDKNVIHGRKVQYRNLLKDNWDIWQTEFFHVKDVNSSSFDYLYLYLDNNPNNLCLEFSVGNSGIVMTNAIIDGIRIEGFGCHGISAKSNSVVLNCEIDAIGGKTQVGYEVFTSLGNGIEFYVSENISDCLVENCRISRCYDCGISIQGSDCGQATPSNICIKNNFIADCCQGWEDFLRNDDNVVYDNCSFQNNIVVNSGMTSGFSYPSRFKYCHVLGNNFKGNRGMIIKNNVFAGGNFYCSSAFEKEYKSNVWIDNVCYIKRGDYILGNYWGTSDVIRIPLEKGSFKSLKAATKDAISRYRTLTGDKTTRFVISGERSLKRKIRKYKHKYENSFS